MKRVPKARDGVKPKEGFTQPFRAYRYDDVDEEREGVLRGAERVLAVLDVGRDVGVERGQQPRLGLTRVPE